MGAGTGAIASHLLRATAKRCRITLVDAALPMLTYARGHMANLERCAFVRASVGFDDQFASHVIPRSGVRYDAVYCGYVLHWLRRRARKVQALNSLRECVSTEGQLIVVACHSGAYEGLLRAARTVMKRPRWRRKFPEGFVDSELPSPAEYRRLFLETGWRTRVFEVGVVDHRMTRVQAQRWFVASMPQYATCLGDRRRAADFGARVLEIYAKDSGALDGEVILKEHKVVAVCEPAITKRRSG